MEYLDVLDGQGKPTGKRKPITDVHRDGDWHRSTHVWVVTPSRQILLQLRSSQKVNYPDMWDISCAGHVSAGDDSRGAAVREFSEELGLEVSKEELEYLFTVTQDITLNDGTYHDREHQDVYVLERDIRPEQIRFPDREVAEVRLVTIEEFEKMVRDENEKLVPHLQEHMRLLEKLRD